MTRTMRRCLLTLLQIFAPARRSWFGLCDMVKICRAGFKAASSLRATHASPPHSQPRTPEGEAMRGTPKNALRFLGTRPYGSGTMFGVARIALAVRDGPRLGYAFS